MLYQITRAVPHLDHTVTVTWSDGVQANVSFAPFLEKGGVFAALKDPDYFVKEMRVLQGGIGLAWPNEVDFSADGVRQAAFPHDPEFQRDMEIARAIMEKRRDVFRKLAKL